MFPFIVKVKYWDDMTDPWKLKNSNLLIYAEDMTAAVGQVERANYFAAVEKVEVSYAGDEGSFFEVPGHIAEVLLAGSSHYKFGLKRVKSAEVAEKLRADASKAEEGLEEKSE